MPKSILTILVFLLMIGCTEQNKNKEKILFITSNQHTYGNTDINTSNHFAEIVLAHNVFIKNGYEVDFVSPEGGAIPVGYIATSDSIQKKYLYDNNFMNLLKNTHKPTDVNAADYQAIYFSGGGAAMFGISENKEVQTLATQIYENEGIISSVCHGTAGIVKLKNEQGKSLYLDKKISGYPDLFENKAAKYYRTFPFSIEEVIRKNKGDFVYSDKKRDNFSVVDGRFITGQDPSATVSVAQKVVEIIQNKPLKK